MAESRITLIFYIEGLLKACKIPKRLKEVNYGKLRVGPFLAPGLSPRSRRAIAGASRPGPDMLEASWSKDHGNPAAPGKRMWERPHLLDPSGLITEVGHSLRSARGSAGPLAFPKSEGLWKCTWQHDWKVVTTKSWIPFSIFTPGRLPFLQRIFSVCFIQDGTNSLYPFF